MRGGRGGEAGGNAGNDFDMDAGGAEGFDFLGGSAEEQRVAAFQADDGFVFVRGIDEERVDFRLR